MKKRAPINISELDIQPLTDEELAVFSEVQGAEGPSDVWICTCDVSRSDTWTCGYIADQ